MTRSNKPEDVRDWLGTREEAKLVIQELNMWTDANEVTENKIEYFSCSAQDLNT